NMVLGFRDRDGFFPHDDTANPGRTVEGITEGDTLRAFASPATGWVLENNGRGPAGQGTGPQNTGQGPGNGKFYFQDGFGGIHDDTSIGGVTQVPGYPDVLTTAFDTGLVVRTGGVNWFNNATGGKTKGYEIYNTGFVGPRRRPSANPTAWAT